MSLAAHELALRRANRWKLAGLLSLLAFVLLLVFLVENLLFSFLVAFVISYSLGPVVSYIERRGVSRGLATTACFLTAGLGLLLVALWVFPYLGRTLSHLQSDMPKYIAGLAQFISELEAKVHSFAGPLAKIDVTGKVESQLTLWTHSFFDQIPSFIKNFFTVMLLGPFLAFFMVKDGRPVMRSLLGLVPNHLFETALSLEHQINIQLGQFVRARILEGLIVALVTAIGLWMIDFPYALLLGLIAGLTNLIPYAGPILGAVPAFLIALVTGASSLEFVLLALVYVIAQLIDAGFLIPLMVAKIVDLHPVTVIIVIIVGAQLMGIVGMIISIPVATTLKVTVSTIYRQLIDTRS